MAMAPWFLGQADRWSRWQPLVLTSLWFSTAICLPGLLALWCVEEWPAREPCPNCKKPRVVDRENCGHCGARFPAPEPKGIEIWEPQVPLPER